MSLSIEAGVVLAERYQLEERIGAGGMGEVWRARHLTLGTDVAVKLIRGGLADSTQGRGRFLREAKASAKLRSSHVVQVLDFGVERETPYLVMELLQGESLHQRLKRGPLEPAELGRVLTEVGRAVSYAHRHDVVHRDLKPENIFLAEDAGRTVAKVLDFGIAKGGASDGDGDAPTTVTGAMLGTPQYMSPEQLLGSRDVDARSDQWALGLIACEALTGQRPVPADSQLLPTVLEGKLPQPSELGEVPTGFDAWFSRSTQRDPAARWGDVSAQINGLRECLGLAPEDMASSGATPPPDPATSKVDTPTAHAETEVARGVETPALHADTLDPAANTKQADPAPAPRPAPKSRAGMWALVGAVVVGLGAVSWQLGSSGSAQAPALAASASAAASATPPSKKPSTRLLIVPPRYVGPKEQRYLADAVTGLLTAKLDIEGELSPIDARAIHHARAELGDDPQKLARRFSAGWIASGEVIASPKRLQLVMELRPSDGSSPPTKGRAEGAPDAIFETADKVAASLLSSRPGATQLTRSASAGTKNVEALRHYIIGEKRYYRADFAGAGKAYQAAIEQDPEFAIAWMRLTSVRSWAQDSGTPIGDPAETLKEVKARVQQLPAREQSLLKGAVTYMEGDYAAAMKAFQTHLVRYPDDVQCWIYRGETEMHLGPLHGRPMQSARKSFERALALDKQFFGSGGHLLWLAFLRGDAAEMDRLSKAALSSKHRLGHRLLRSGVDADLKAFAQAADAVVASKAPVGSFLHPALVSRPRLLEILASKVLATDRAEPPFDMFVGQAFLMSLTRQRRFREIDDEIADKLKENPTAVEMAAVACSWQSLCPERIAKRLDPLLRQRVPKQLPYDFPHHGIHELVRVYSRAALALRFGDRDAAAALYGDIRAAKTAADMPDLPNQLVATLEAWNLFLDGKYDEALRSVEQLVPRTPSSGSRFVSPVATLVHARWLRAESLAKLGRTDEARRWYVSLQDTYADILPLSLRRLAELSEGDDAQHWYRRFILLQEKADPEFQPEVEEAEKALRELETAP